MHVLKRNLNRNALSRRMLAASIAAIVSLAVPLAMMQAVATPPVLRDSDARKKGQETVEDAPAKPDPQIAKWISQLGSKEFNVRRRATRLLTKAGPKALPAVLEAIQSKDAEVRKRAVGIVTRAGTKSIPALQGAIESKQAEVRNQAFEILLAFLKSDDEATANAVWKAAEQLLQSPDRDRVAKAREILEHSENYAKRMIRKFGSSNCQIVERDGKVRKLWGNLAEAGPRVPERA